MSNSAFELLDQIGVNIMFLKPFLWQGAPFIQLHPEQYSHCYALRHCPSNMLRSAGEAGDEARRAVFGFGLFWDGAAVRLI